MIVNLDNISMHEYLKETKNEILIQNEFIEDLKLI